LDPNIGARLREARERRHMTQEQVGDLTGRTHGAVGAWERGLAGPDLATLIAVAELYNVTVGWIVEGEEMSSGIEARIKKIPRVLRAALVERLHKEIDATEDAAARLPPEMLNGAPVKDADPRLKDWKAPTKDRSGTQ
jgi:transcriptional regulator with XRE-family HTH domain